MSFNITNKLNNLSATTEIIINNLADLQTLIGSYLTLDDARAFYQLLSNIASDYNSNPTDTIYYNAKYISSLISNYQKTVSCSLPLSISNKVLSIDLSAHQKNSKL